MGNRAGLVREQRPMSLSFPEHFIFGTSTAAAQIETAFEHDW
ncbi:MAG: family 1 glycosylhydrolase [Cyclobacteriaceae bacterium]|nr:family 1 glycosylhydrolase [Cyclobacteriaceae bacterium]UYN85260.1 MAG: family 1 glycosylhydrolase [Cyclobacteriaceae bacterium]